MKLSTLSMLFLLFSATFAHAQTTWSWDQAPPEDMLGNRGEIAKTILTTKDENVLLGIWQRSETDETVLYLKMLAAKRLAMYGTKAAVPVLAPCLGNEMDSFFARYALETIPGAEVDAALCESLKTIKDSKILAGILTTLGVRGNSNSAASVKLFLTHENADVRRAAGYAYALTAGNEGMAFFASAQLDPIFADSGFLFAEQFKNKGDTAQAVRIYDALASANIKEYQKLAAVYHGILTLGLSGVDRLFQQFAPGLPKKQFDVGLKVGRELPADVRGTVAQVLGMQFFAQTDQLRRAKIVRALGDRRDKESKAVVLAGITKLARGEFPDGQRLPQGTDKTVDVAVRVAAIDALRNIGDGSVVAVLIEAANQTEEKSVADAAKNALAKLPGKEADDAICGLLEENNSAVRIAAINLVAERRIFSATPTLIKILGDSDTAVSDAAVAALGEISGITDLPVLFGLLRQTGSDAEAQKIIRVLKSACTRFPQDAAATEVAKALEGSSTALKTQLLDLLKQIAGAKSLEIVNGYAWGDDAEMRNVATRILGEWLSPSDLDLIAAACLKLAKESPDYKIRGLRSYLRLARQFDMPAERKMSMCQEVFDLADRDDEKRLVFGVYSRIISIEALEKAASYLGNATLQESAAEAVVTIAGRFQGNDPKITETMKKVLELNVSEPIKERALRVLERQ